MIAISDSAHARIFKTRLPACRGYLYGAQLLSWRPSELYQECVVAIPVIGSKRSVRRELRTSKRIDEIFGINFVFVQE
jgi:hypothetical protein